MTPTAALARTAYNLTGLDANGNTLIEVIALNGTTPVVSTNTFTRLRRSFLLGAGANGSNEGGITMSGTVDAVVGDCIPAERGISDSCVYTVPNGQSTVLNQMEFSASKVAGGQPPIVTFRVYARFGDPGAAWIIILERDMDTATQNQTLIPLPVYPLLLSLADVRVAAISSENNTRARARMSGVAFDN